MGAALSVVCGLLSTMIRQGTRKSMSRHFIVSDIAMTSKSMIIFLIIHFNYILQRYWFTIDCELPLGWPKSSFGFFP